MGEVRLRLPSERVPFDRPRSDWFGFGIERIGIVALRIPVATCILIAISVAVSLLSLPQLSFDGDVARLLNSERENAKVYRSYAQNYPSLTADVVVRVSPSSGEMMTPEAIGSLEDYANELALLDGVRSVFAPTSFRTIRRGRLERIFDRNQSPEALRKAVASSAVRHPEIRGVVSAGAALVFVSLQPDASKSNVALTSLLSKIEQGAVDHGLDVVIAGPAAIQAELIGDLISDQILIIVLGSIAGIAIAVLVFRDWRSVLLTTAATTTSMIWVVGAMIAADRPLDAITTILPILASVLAFADSVHLIVDLGRQPTNLPLNQALRRSIRTVGPATALTSITTAIAFGTLAFGGTAMTNLAIFGALASGLAMLSVLVVVPSAAALLLKRAGRPRAPMARASVWVPALSGCCCRFPRLVVTASTALLVVVLWFHLTNEPEFHPHENLSNSSSVQSAAKQIDAEFGGTRHVVVLVPLLPDEDVGAPETRARLISAHDAVSAHLGRDATASAASLWRVVAEMGHVDPDIIDKIADAPNTVALDRSSMPVLARIPSEWSAADIRRLMVDLSADPKLRDTTVTGFAVMSSMEAFHVISNLKVGLLIAVVVTALVIAIRLRSPLAFVGYGLANVLVVLSVEAMMGTLGLPADFAIYIALTVALGIGGDDAVHILNARRRESGPEPQAILNAITRTAPALALSTIVLSANLLVTTTSDLRPVWLIGGVVSATLVVAFFANVVVLPAVLALGGRR